MTTVEYTFDKEETIHKEHEKIAGETARVLLHQHRASNN